MYNTISPAIDKYVQTEEFLNRGKDPVGDGALKGIEAAKSSLSLSPILRRPPPVARAISGGAAAFQPPTPGAGSAGMLQSIAQAMGPAMQEYYKELDTRQALQMHMAEAEQKQQNQLAEQMYRQSHLQEQIRHNQANERHQMAMEANRRRELASMFTEEGIDLSDSPEIKGAALAKVNYEKKELAEGLRAVEEIKKKRTRLNELTKEDTIPQSAPFHLGTVSNAAKDVYGRVFSTDSAKKERQITLARKELERATREFKVTGDRALKGGGMLAQGMYKQMNEMNLWPEATDPTDDFDNKIRQIEEKMVPKYKALEVSSKYRRFVDPIQFEKMYGNSEQPEITEKSGAENHDFSREELAIAAEEIAAERQANGR